MIQRIKIVLRTLIIGSVVFGLAYCAYAFLTGGNETPVLIEFLGLLGLVGLACVIVALITLFLHWVFED